MNTKVHSARLLAASAIHLLLEMLVDEPQTPEVKAEFLTLQSVNRFLVERVKKDEGIE